MTTVYFHEWSNGRLRRLPEDLPRKIDARKGATKRVPEIVMHLEAFVRRHKIIPDGYGVAIDGAQVQSGEIDGFKSGDFWELSLKGHSTPLARIHSDDLKAEEVEA